MECLSGRMSADDLLDLACILARSNTTLVDAEGHVVIDWWGEFTDAAGQGGLYVWRPDDD